MTKLYIFLHLKAKKLSRDSDSISNNNKTDKSDLDSDLKNKSPTLDTRSSYDSDPKYIYSVSNPSFEKLCIDVILSQLLQKINMYIWYFIVFLKIK